MSLCEQPGHIRKNCQSALHFCVFWQLQHQWCILCWPTFSCTSVLLIKLGQQCFVFGPILLTFMRWKISHQCCSNLRVVQHDHLPNPVWWHYLGNPCWNTWRTKHNELWFGKQCHWNLMMHTHMSDCRSFVMKCKPHFSIQFAFHVWCLLSSTHNPIVSGHLVVKLCKAFPSDGNVGVSCGHGAPADCNVMLAMLEEKRRVQKLLLSQGTAVSLWMEQPEQK